MSDANFAKALTVSGASSSSSASFDAPSMIKACLALSGEISLEKLLLRLMQVALENAGAERSALLLHQGSSGELLMAAELSPDNGARVLSEPEPLREMKTS